MAKRIEVLLTCDVHDGGAGAVASVALTLDGQVFECDLCEEHLAELQRTFTFWSSHARSAGAENSRPKRRVAQPPRAGVVRRAKRLPVHPQAQERRERMLVASEEIFAEMGYEATSTNLIAQRAETSVGSVYSFFGSKEAIAVALFERYLLELKPRYDQAVRSGEGVHVLVDLVNDFLMGHPALRPLLRNRWGGGDLRAASRSFRASLAIPVERLIGGQREVADPFRLRIVAEMCAALLWSMVDEAAELPRRRQPARLAELKLMLVGYVGAGVAAA